MGAGAPAGAARGLTRKAPPARARSVRVEVPCLPATLTLPPGARALVICTHDGAAEQPIGIAAAPPADEGYGARHAAVSRLLAQHGLATLFVHDRAEFESPDEPLATDLARLVARALEALDWAAGHADLAQLRTGLWATGVAAAASLIAATKRSARVAAVVASSGRPDLAGAALARVAVPTLLIVGGNDVETLGFNRTAMLALTGEKRLEVVPGVTRGFEEPGALEALAHLAGSWLAGRLSAGYARH